MCKSPLNTLITADSKILNLIVPVTVQVNTEAYELNYGRSDDIPAYTAEIVRDAANERFKLLDWAVVNTEASPTGYICKQCGGASPVGIGYAANTPQVSDVESCPCGHSRKPESVKDGLAKLIEQGLTFADCVEAFGTRQSDEEKYFVDLARDEWEKEGQIEIDDNAIVAGSSDHGDYVLAWLWVSDPRPNPQFGDTEHEDGDGCAIYDTGYRVRSNGDDDATTSVEDLETGDTYNDPAYDDDDTWHTVAGVTVVDQEVHITSDEDEEDESA